MGRRVALSSLESITHWMLRSGSAIKAWVQLSPPVFGPEVLDSQHTQARAMRDVAFLS